MLCDGFDFGNAALFECFCGCHNAALRFRKRLAQRFCGCAEVIVAGIEDLFAQLHTVIIGDAAEPACVRKRDLCAGRKQRFIRRNRTDDIGCQIGFLICQIFDIIRRFFRLFAGLGSR